MKVLQLIDSLEAGGAERVAVNYANGLLNHVEGSYLCATRAEGLLKQSLNPLVGYLFLNKKATIDFKAIWRLHRFVKQEGIIIIHAHSSSYFLATLITFLQPKIKLVWHDHYGKSEFLEQRSKRVLKYCSQFFKHIFSVNVKLADWAKSTLHCQSVGYLPNYAVADQSVLTTDLKGVKGHRIVCLANLRPQKDHLNLLRAFNVVINKYPDWTLHLVGKDFEDDYSQRIKTYIKGCKLEQSVFLYGSCTAVSSLLKSCDIGVLSSASEGLPLALLEYGLASLPVVATNVGDCNQVIKPNETGLLIRANDSVVLAEALIWNITNINKRELYAKRLSNLINNHFSEISVLEIILNTYSRL